MSGILNRTFLRRGGVFASVAVFCVITSGLLAASAQETTSRAKVEELLRGSHSHGLGPVAISPDGSLLAYVHQGKDGWGVELAPFSDPGKTTRITATKKAGASCGEGMVQ